MRHFRRPLIVTGVTIAVVIVLGLAATFWINASGVTPRRAAQRIQMIGGGLGTLTAIVIAPFWIMAASKVADERRQPRRHGPRKHK